MTHDLDAFMATMVAQSRPVPEDCAVALARERYGLAFVRRHLACLAVP